MAGLGRGQGEINWEDFENADFYLNTMRDAGLGKKEKDNDSGSSDDSFCSAISSLSPEETIGSEMENGNMTDVGSEADDGNVTEAGSATENGNMTDAGTEADDGNVTDAGSETDDGSVTPTGTETGAESDLESIASTVRHVQIKSDGENEGAVGGFRRKVKKVYEKPGSDFIPPDVAIIPEFKDLAGKEVNCIAGSVHSPSEFYLTFAWEVPEILDKFIETMTWRYHELANRPNRSVWMLLGSKIQLRPGYIVACFNTSGSARTQKEVVRGKIIKPFISKECPEEEEFYRVFCIDLGEYINVRVCDMFQLHEDFVGTPARAIKCRFALSQNYEKFHSGNKKWNVDITKLMIQVIHNKTTKVRFVRQVVENGEPIWEVSIPDTPVHHNHPLIGFRRGPLEQRIIKAMMGKYVDDKMKVDYL